MLGKDFTLENVRGNLRTLSDQIAEKKITDPEIDNMIHMGICHLVGRLGDAVNEDYGERVAVSLTSTPDYADVVTATSYNNTTKTVSETTHGLSIGTPLVYWDDGGKMAIGYVVTTPTAGTFTINIDIGATVTNFKYVVFTAYNGGAIDISSLRLNNIIKIVDDTNGLVVPDNSVDIEGEEKNPQRRKNSYWYRHGNYVYILKGSEAPAFGTLYLFYNRIPTKATADTDYLDIKDEFVKLATDVTKIMIYETLKETPPEALTNTVNDAINQIVASNIREMTAVNEAKNPKK